MSHIAHLEHLLERQRSNNRQLESVLHTLIGTWPEDAVNAASPADDTVASLAVQLTDSIDNASRLLNMLDEFVMRPRADEASPRGMDRPGTSVRYDDGGRAADEYAGRLH